MSDQRPRDALAHLQAAANEVIAAARIVLDMADELVNQSIRIVGEMGDGERHEARPGPVVEKIPVAGREDDEADL